MTTSHSSFIEVPSTRLHVCLEIYCGKMADGIWLAFQLVSMVGRGMDVLDCGSRASMERGGFGGFPSLVSMAYFSNRNVFNSCMKVDNVSMQTIYHWKKRLFIGFSKI